MAGPKKRFNPDAVRDRARQRLGMAILPGSEDRAGLLALERLLYPQLDIHDPRYLAWQYEHNPAGPAYERLGKVHGQIIGQYSVIPLQMQVAGQEVKGSMSLNTMTHVDYRGQGVFMLLADEVFKACQADDARLTLGFPNPNSYPGFLRHLNFKDIGHLPLWIRPLNLAELAKAPKVKNTPILPLLLKMFSPAWNLTVSSRAAGMDSPAKPITSFDGSFNMLWEKTRGSYKNLVVRNQRYLQWRFAEHPTRKYAIYAVGAGQDLAGYGVTRISAIEEIRCGMIVDLFTAPTPEGEKVAAQLIRKAVQNFHQEGVALAGCLAPRKSAAGRALRRCGFLPCPEFLLPQPFPVILRWNSLEAPPTGVDDLNQWYLTMGDYDAV